jgi:hypothetical protein
VTEIEFPHKGSAEKFRIPHATLKGFEDLLGLGVRASVDHRGAPCEVAGMRRRGWPTGKQRATLVSGAEESGERRETWLNRESGV